MVSPIRESANRETLERLVFIIITSGQLVFVNEILQSRY